MVPKNPIQLSAWWKTIIAVAAGLLTLSALWQLAYSQAVNKLDDNFTTDEEFAEHVKAADQKFSTLVESVDKNTTSIDQLVTVTRELSLSSLNVQISNLKSTLAEMEDNRGNWKQYERGIFREKSQLLSDLEAQRSRLVNGD